MKIGHLFVRDSDVMYVKKFYDPLQETTTFWIYFRSGDCERIDPKEGELELLQQHMELFDKALLKCIS